MTTIQKLFDFHGRIRRSTWWAWVLLTIIVSSFIAWVVSGLLVGDAPYTLADRVERKICWLVMIWPLMALNAKRSHDLGWSGWWTLLSFIPLVNLIYWFRLGFEDGQPGDNAHGPSPKSAVAL